MRFKMKALLLPLCFAAFIMLLIAGCKNNVRDTADGRIPGCLSDGGIDLFAAEGDGVLGLTWNNVGGWDASGGYRVRFGPVQNNLNSYILVDFSGLACEFNLEGLENDVTLWVEIDSLNADGQVTQTSCIISATPHALYFRPDTRVNASESGRQDFPAIVVAGEGIPLFVAWEDGEQIAVTRSDNLGDTWSTPVNLGGYDQKSPALAFRDELEVVDYDGNTAALPPLLFVSFTEGTAILVARGVFPQGLDGAVVFDTIVEVGEGMASDIAVEEDRIYIAWESEGAIFASSADPETLLFTPEVRVDSGSGDAHAPSIAITPGTDKVFVGYHAKRGSGDFNVYLNTSHDGSITFATEEVRIDDDPTGQNQLNISIAVDWRTGQVQATWEDRRGGANVFFSTSNNDGNTWLPNIPTGAGLNGDQFTPQAVADPGRNIYIIFLDTSNGQKPMFSRFNPDGTFDPPLPISMEAGTAGAAACNPAVAIDKYGTIYAVWAENRDSPDVDIYFARAE